MTLQISSYYRDNLPCRSCPFKPVVFSLSLPTVSGRLAGSLSVCLSLGGVKNQTDSTTTSAPLDTIIESARSIPAHISSSVGRLKKATVIGNWHHNHTQPYPYQMASNDRMQQSSKRICQTCLNHSLPAHLATQLSKSRKTLQTLHRTIFELSLVLSVGL